MKTVALPSVSWYPASSRLRPDPTSGQPVDEGSVDGGIGRRPGGRAAGRAGADPSEAFAAAATFAMCVRIFVMTLLSAARTRVTREAPAKRRRERAKRRAVCEAGKDV
jgi:hypothetical protein